MPISFLESLAVASIPGNIWLAKNCRWPLRGTKEAKKKVTRLAIAGERSAQIRIGIAWFIVVDIETIGVEIAHIDQLAVGRTLFCVFPS